MKRLINFVLVNIFIVQIVAGQMESNNWFFGANGGLSFSTGRPVFQAGSQMNAPEGCSAISDKQGNLLMYSNGETVWNKNHQPMPNGTGLNGDPGSTQSVVITTHPTDPNTYYIFTTGKEGSGTLGYSIVDMRLNGGLGDVSSKNGDLGLPGCEKITAVKHRNGSDIWVITHMYQGNLFLVYSITCSASPLYPSVYSVGSTINTPGNTRGYMKVSPDGKKLVMANAEGNLELFNFNDATGVINNPQSVSSASAPCGPYGAEFSPDSRLLYVTESCNAATSYSIFQYDITSANISASKVIVNTGSANPAGALQLGPDNKIYIAFDQASYLGAIVSPNTPGAGCNFQKQFVTLPASAKSGAGLPSSAAGIRKTLLGDDTTFCDISTKVLKPNLARATYTWSDKSVADSFIVSAPGLYWVDVVQTDLNGNSCRLTDSIYVKFARSPAFSLGKDTNVCANILNLPLNAPVPGATYLWQDSTTGSSTVAKAPGLYWLQTSLNGCSFRDSIVVASSPLPAFSLRTDTIICGNQPLVIGTNLQGANYLWSTGSTANSISVDTTGLYWLEATTGTGCSFRDTVNLVFNPLPSAILGNDTTVCALPLTIGRTIAGATYLWQDGSANSTLPVVKPGLYWVDVSLNGCKTRDSINILGNPVTAFNLGRDTTLCGNQPFALNGPANVSGYLWSTGETSQNINVTTSGTYWLKTTNTSGCSYADTIDIRLNPTTIVNLGNDTILCRLPYTIGQNIPGASYQWQDGSSNAFYTANAPGIYWVQVSVNGCSSRDSIDISFGSAFALDLGNDIVTCSSQPLTLEAGIYQRYLWSTGSTSKSISVSNSGVYWLEVTSQSGCNFRDSINITLTPSPKFSLGRDTTLCQNEVLVLDVSNTPGVYYWQNQSTGPTFQVDKAGTYHVTVVDNGCSRSDTIAVTYKLLPAPNLGPDQGFCPGEQLILNPNTLGTAYTWQDGSRLPTFKVTQPGKYRVSVQNECGTGTDEILVTAGACSLQFPNAFTPGKRPNDLFRLVNGSGVTDFRLQVYNRWGQTVYQSSNAAEGWDGKNKGVEQPSGTYIFVTSYVDNSGKLFSQKGTVVLIR